MNEVMNKYQVGEITSGFGLQIAGVDVWFDEGELVYVLSEIFDESDPDFILWYVIMKPVSKDVLRVNSDFINLISRGNVLRFAHFD